ncbi:vWA domain-containing protein [Intrasporangium sp. YIM S08009]|uniref:vWA domain-containing protein n=1 Tax=Intrasporangium zincisolvens TaxID=3080018 RepID=UPI002B0546C0|nr:vWA domain-containing protein [Intrasporangium sp. YIM S08009]
MLNGMRRGALSILATGALVAVPTVASGAGVAPAGYDDSLDPGQTVHVTKTVTTPEIPPKPDIVLVVDETGSMGSAIANVKSEMSSIVTSVQGAQPLAQFAVTSYRDVSDGAQLFQVETGLTGDQTTAQNAIDSLSAGGGGDLQEGQLNALWEVGSGGNAIAYRPGSSRIVVWFGDASGHDPSNGHTEADALGSLQGVSAQVIAINVSSGSGDGLDATGQASRITSATSGTFFPSVAPGGVASAILAGLGNLPAEVTANVSCDPGLSVAYSPSLPQTVTSGTDLVLDEAVTVAADAPQGSTLTCTTTFLVNGADAGPDFVQTVRIAVNDVTPPTADCGPGVNPAGKTPPGYASAGFYRLLADDNLPGVSVTVSDTASSATFGPYAPGTTIKLTQAPGATPSAVPGSGAVDWHVTVKGDLLVTATDAAGNTATATCTVPPKQK